MILNLRMRASGLGRLHNTVNLQFSSLEKNLEEIPARLLHTFIPTGPIFSTFVFPNDIWRGFTVQDNIFSSQMYHELKLEHLRPNLIWSLNKGRFAKSDEIIFIWKTIQLTGISPGTFLFRISAHQPTSLSLLRSSNGNEKSFLFPFLSRFLFLSLFLSFSFSF